ncbi:hypothetical protein HOD19_01185 [bacterium]|jgi:hypothetical protein|nr:hypothetical protein [bacterium]MBT4649379.1 hypothetical protein [bacterium]
MSEKTENILDDSKIKTALAETEKDQAIKKLRKFSPELRRRKGEAVQFDLLVTNEKLLEMRSTSREFRRRELD